MWKSCYVIDKILNVKIMFDMLPLFFFFNNDSYKMKLCTKLTKWNEIQNKEFSNEDGHQIIYWQCALGLLLADDSDSTTKNELGSESKI